jgi:hypothetical protein
MHEFVSAGGELIIHGALHLLTSPTPELTSVHPEIVDFGSGQDLSVFATTGIVRLFRGLQKSENAALGQKMLFPDGHLTKKRSYLR